MSEDPDRLRRFQNVMLIFLDEVYTVALYYMRSPVDADDAVQECFVRAYQHFDSFCGTAAKAWLMAILRNVCRAEYSRRISFQSTLPESAAPEYAIPLWQEATELPEAKELRREQAEIVHNLIVGLPAEFREVIVLRHFADLSYEEIAHMVRVPIGTVMSRLARARALLRTGYVAQGNATKSRGQAGAIGIASPKD